MPPSDVVRLRHMLDAAREAITFGAGRTMPLLKMAELADIIGGQGMEFSG
jgi:hypothetical protein